MASSTRIGYTGGLEIHLKKQLEITREMVNQISTLPGSAPWYVAAYDLDQNDWRFGQSFGSFPDAEERFITMCENNGVDAGRLEVPRGPNGREVGR